MRSSSTTPRPWYRETWAWFLIAILCSSFVVGGILLYFAVNGQDSLVRDDYYKAGLAINTQIEKDKTARALGLTSRVEFKPDQSIRIWLSGTPAFVAPEFLKLVLIHPTLAGRDQDLRLMKQPDGSYLGILHEPVTGKWHLDLRDPEEQWRLKTEANLSQPTTIQLDPPAAP